MLLGPVAGSLKAKRLLIVGDGRLNYVPFAALLVSDLNAAAGQKVFPKSSANTRRPLIVDHEIVNLPSASTLSALRRDLAGRRPAPKMVGILADPVFDRDDERVHASEANRMAGQSVSTRLEGEHVSPESLAQIATERSLREMGATYKGSLPRLPFSRREAELIYGVATPREALKALDFAASKKTAVGPQMSEYRILHFATHGLLNNEHPDLSGLVFSLVDERGNSQNGFLRLFEVYNMKLNAELVVLSACQTALGKEIKGEGLITLTRGFMYAGAARVVATLWKVDDEATAEFMRKFYEEMLKEGRRPAAALRSAQLWMQEQKRWRDPYFWAGFVLQGEWR